MAENGNKQVRPFWLLAGLSILTIIFGIVTICSPAFFRNIMDIFLGIILVMTGISAIINTIKNKNTEFIRLLLTFGILITIVGFLLIFSRTQFVGTIIIWVFALWALIRGIILILFGLSNKNNQPLWWAIIGLGILLFILSIVIICVPKSESRTRAGICIGISTVLDGISLLIFSLKVKNNPALQTELVNQANQNEIAQGSVIITKTTVITQTDAQPNPETQQPNNENQA